MSPKELISKWVELFNAGEAESIGVLYHERAINHQIPNKPIKGRKAIREMFRNEFQAFEMTCIVENLFEDGEWAILEWKDPIGLRGCGFFHVIDDQIIMQRGYWDKMSFLKQQGLSSDE